MSLRQNALALIVLTVLMAIINMPVIKNAIFFIFVSLFVAVAVTFMLSIMTMNNNGVLLGPCTG